MSTTIEVSAGSIRLVRETRGRIATLESWPVPVDGDPLATLAGAPLPRPLGKVTVLMHHPDLLLKTMMQPPAPADRLARIVRFELQGMAGESGEAMAVAWHVVKVGGSGDMRILALLAKRRLVDDVRKALAPHGGKLDRLVHPAVALYHAWRRQVVDPKGDVVIVDVGGKHVHLALANDGELLFVRTQQPGAEDLVRQVAELRGIPPFEAARLLAKMGKGAPADLHDLIKRQAQALAATLSNNVRFARAQLHIDKLEPASVWLSGAGAQVVGFAEALAERFGKPVQLINPFAGALTELPAADMDRQAALPSAWSPAIGAAYATSLELDAASEDREARQNFWRTDGAVRAACAAAVVLIALGAVRQGVAHSGVGTTLGALVGTEGSGLVPRAEKVHEGLKLLTEERRHAADRVAFLDGERRPGRVALELLSAIAEQQDPVTSPMVLREYRVRRDGPVTKVEIEGFAESAAKRSTADVQRTFERELARRYEPIAALAVKPATTEDGRLRFHFVIEIPDRQPTASTSAYATKGGGKGLRIEVRGAGALDHEGVARVAADRHRDAEDEVTIVVTGDDPEAADTWMWTAKGLTRSR